MVESHACLHCGSAFSSKNKLFAHLRGSECTAAAAADGLEVGAAQEKVALILGCLGSEGDWKSALWEAIDVARGVGRIQGLESYARLGGPPGAAFASDARDARALRHDARVPRAGDVLSLTTEVVATTEQREEWCARANGVLPPGVRILGRSEALPTSFHADLCCLRRNYECMIPAWLLAPDAVASEAAAGVSEEGGAVASERPQQHVKRGEGDPRWGDREACLEHFQRLKGLLHRFQGEHHFHNFAAKGSRITPGEAVARRHVYKFRAGDERWPGVRSLSLAVDALLAGQLEAMAGLAVAVLRGLLPESYLDVALGDEALLDVPRIPEGMMCWSGCIYPKQYHYRLQPLMDSAEASAWLQRVEEGLVTRARGGAFAEWLGELVAKAPTLALQLHSRSAAVPPQVGLAGDAPDIYLPVLRLLREAEASGKWPGISKGREKVILESTLSEHGGGGGSFSVGSMPGHLEEPAGNQLFPDLVRCAFELERALMPGRAPSSTIAINKRAQFLPHVDSGAGAGQGISLIVGLGDYTGGELVVEGEQHDIRYSPLEFCGWTQRHWTLPFDGERFSLVWFTPRGCEGRPGMGRRWGSASREPAMEEAGSAPAASGEGEQAGAGEECVGGSSTSRSPSAAEPRCLQLKGGLELQRISYGTYQLKWEACEAAVLAALETGYRLIDTASIYRNEEAVGRAISRWEKEHPSQVGTVQVLSKCSNHEMGFEKARAAFEASLQRLGREVLDVYIIHWPAVAKKRHASSEHRAARHQTWRALEALKREGRVRVIGVSNFTAQHLQQLLEDGVEVLPMLNQIEAHPLFLPSETIDFCEKNGIVVQAYSPLGGGPGSNCSKATGGEANGTRLLLGHSVLRGVAEELGRSPAQVALRWGLQRGFAVVPHSSNAARIAENFSVFDFSLSAAQMAALDTIRSESFAQKFCWDPSMIH